MIYNTDEERQQLRVGLDILFAEHGRTNLMKVCRENELNYNHYKHMIYRGKIDHDDLETLIHKITPDRFIQKRNGKLVIAKRF